MTAAKWFPGRRPSPRAKVRLFCFPYAGGGASAFRGWREQLPAEIEVCPVEPPGRETRFSEPFVRSVPELVDGAMTAMRDLLDLPFALFGHSLGARVAFEIARKLVLAGKPPRAVIASGSAGPRVDRREEAIAHLPHDAFVEKLRELEGTPAAVLENPELLEVYLPLLRADFAMAESYRYEPGAPLACRVCVYGGLEDKSVGPEDLAAWKDESATPPVVRRFPGNHFFLLRSMPLVVEAVARDVLLAG